MLTTSVEWQCWRVLPGEEWHTKAGCNCEDTSDMARLTDAA
jgi:hypothetical protein